MTGYMVEFELNGKQKWTTLKAESGEDADRISREYFSKQGTYKPLKITELGKGKNGRVWIAQN